MEVKVEMEEREVKVQRALKWLQDITKGAIGYEIETRTLQGLEDVNGNWHVGAMATIIDNVGAAAIYSAGDSVKLTVNFNISYYSTAKIQEEVEIEAKVIGNKGKLTSVVVEVRKKDGELIAIGKQWTASNDIRAPWDRPSKL
ncbi:hypothetical protein PTKIN_Ptkin18bG0059200 [Pterospermum kingtungense]